jgi:hypothetical protein
MSIKMAALELRVTPSAVSHRLRVLELMLGRELLRRVGSRLELTEAEVDCTGADGRLQSHFQRCEYDPAGKELIDGRVKGAWLALTDRR